MTLQIQDIARELPGVVQRFRRSLEGTEIALGDALRRLDAWTADPEGTNDAIERAMSGNPAPFALTYGEAPGRGFDPPPFRPCVVIAADGSTIPVDRFAPVPCYVVNTGKVALPYAVPGPVTLEAEARLGPPAAGDPDPAVGFAGLDLLRDVLELEAACALAVQRVSSFPTVVLLDGTLLPWDLDSPQVEGATRERLRDRTQAALDALQQLPGELALGSYVSASRAGDVVTSLACLRPQGPLEPVALTGDSIVFRTLLAEGQRSAVFRAKSERTRRVESQFAPDHQVCFFYLRLGDEIARVEAPRWAMTPGRIGLLHATLIDQCLRCQGYPRALQEAHEQAVINGSDRDLFARLLERESWAQGLPATAAGKQASKRRRAL